MSLNLAQGLWRDQRPEAIRRRSGEIPRGGPRPKYLVVELRVRKGIQSASLNLTESDSLPIFTVVIHLFPVSGTPQAKATCTWALFRRALPEPSNPLARRGCSSVLE